MATIAATDSQKWTDIMRDMTTARRCPCCGCRVEAFVIVGQKNEVHGRYYTEENANRRRREVGGTIIRESLQHCEGSAAMAPVFA